MPAGKISYEIPPRSVGGLGSSKAFFSLMSSPIAASPIVPVEFVPSLPDASGDT
ncbi:hypothetical protein [Catenulispora sp. MAP12-49]|uniref:hypothetical protein n=1 Tax=Catenulispora sp. MAP12-49 TaxID=3156302 RepID=UPI0035117EFE